jgi:hypothetical protein
MSSTINQPSTPGRELKVYGNDYRNKRILEVLNQFNIAPESFDPKKINWIQLAKKINTSTFLMRIPEHRAVSPIEIYQFYLKHYKVMDSLKKWTP